MLVSVCTWFQYFWIYLHVTLYISCLLPVSDRVGLVLGLYAAYSPALAYGQFACADSAYKWRKLKVSDWNNVNIYWKYLKCYMEKYLRH